MDIIEHPTGLIDRVSNQDDCVSNHVRYLSNDRREIDGSRHLHSFNTGRFRVRCDRGPVRHTVISPRR